MTETEVTITTTKTGVDLALFIAQFANISDIVAIEIKEVNK